MLCGKCCCCVFICLRCIETTGRIKLVFLFFTYPTLCCKEMWVFPKIRVLPSGTAPNSVHLKSILASPNCNSKPNPCIHRWDVLCRWSVRVQYTSYGACKRGCGAQSWDCWCVECKSSAAAATRASAPVFTVDFTSYWADVHAVVRSRWAACGRYCQQCRRQLSYCWKWCVELWNVTVLVVTAPVIDHLANIEWLCERIIC